MKCVITYLQNKRIALPYLFGKYCLPEMRRRFPGELKVAHIFHEYHTPWGGDLASNRLGEDGLWRVRMCIAAGFYPQVGIIRHQEVHPEYALLPSCRRAAEYALAERADLHLWLEDDAIIHDLDCGFWYATLHAAQADVGLYRNSEGSEMVHAAFFLSTPAFDRSLLQEIPSYKREDWAKYKDKGSQYEHMLWRCSKKRVLLDTGAAERHHPYPPRRHTGTEVRRWLRSRLPGILDQDLVLMGLDFND